MGLIDVCTVPPIPDPSNCQEVAHNWLKLAELAGVVCDNYSMTEEIFEGVIIDNVTLSSVPYSGHVVKVYLNGMIQDPVDDYVRVDDLITFPFNLETDDVVRVEYYT